MYYRWLCLACAVFCFLAACGGGGSSDTAVLQPSSDPPPELSPFATSTTTFGPLFNRRDDGLSVTARTADGGYLLGGDQPETSVAEPAFVSCQINLDLDGSFLHLTRTDADLNRLWVQDFAGSLKGWLQGVREFSDGSIGVVAIQAATDAQPVAPMFYNLVFICLDTAGQELWRRTVLVKDLIYFDSLDALAIAETEEGDYLVAGATSSSAARFSACFKPTGETHWINQIHSDTLGLRGAGYLAGNLWLVGRSSQGDGSHALWLGRVDGEGRLVDSGETVIGRDAEGLTVTRLGNGTPVVGGRFTSTEGKSLGFVAGMDSVTEIRWLAVQEYPVHRVEATRDGGFVALGRIPAGQLLELARFDHLGRRLWQQSLGPVTRAADRLVGTSIEETEDGGFLLQGREETHWECGTNSVAVSIKTDADGNVRAYADSLAGLSLCDNWPLEIDYSRHFTDPNGDVLYFSAEGLAPGMQLDPKTGILIGPVPDVAGEMRLRFELSATDPGGQRTTVSRDIFIRDRSEQGCENFQGIYGAVGYAAGGPGARSGHFDGQGRWVWNFPEWAP